ncbi:hypothetical protein LY90DRAFT_504663 [Neocallimastix californiae]|uniref:Periplasmic binding protein-like II n=1 Tax=Neocallimastix californiae TaxID=1754190 RepID=A0A1Y2E5M7_9FUNG|nr:hypothetical protein LY90DRAFT_504663 [Neocallimastix californiae]|eukprot:ORY66870.1 hypothetical protein LY90DRAFT_504663 [Neocallimastix californiae]
MMTIYELLIIIFILNLSCVNAVTINALACSFLEEKNIYTPLAKEFNRYSRENNLNITLHLDLITESNSTQDIDDYGSTMEYYFNRESSLYDLYFYDNIYTIRYSSKMLDLKQYLTKEHIDLYSAVPVSIDYAVLYSNTKYLEKYKKDIPKTWNELLETGKFIQEEEK